MQKMAASKYDIMKKEFSDVGEIFLDDTKNSEQTIQLITEVAEAAVAVQGLSEIVEKNDKAMVMGLMGLEIAVGQLRAAVIDETA